MFRARKAIALTALLMLGGLVVTADPRGPAGTYERWIVAMWVLLAPLTITVLALARNRPWGRWMALAAGIAVLPTFLISWFNVPFHLGGTGLLIVVGVTLDTVQQIESHLLMRHYEGFLKAGSSIRGRR